MTQKPRLRPRDRDAILQSLSAGVVPRRGHQHIQVGRAEEVRALLSDIERVSDGGSTVRFIIGQYGAGKTFFLHLIRSIALEKNLVTMHADLTPDRRLHATGGQARTLYAELVRNTATRATPEGNALGNVVEKFITSARQEAESNRTDVELVIQTRLNQLSEMVGGYDFASVIGTYWRGYDQDNEGLKAAAVRWLRGEYTTKTDARTDLGVRTIVDDANVYDQLKLFARFIHLAGYSGLIVALDEMVNLYKLAHSQARNSNYEQILKIVNDCLQGSVEHLGFLMGGTPEFLMDTRRGLYSYEALQSRLAENSFATEQLRDFSGPVIRLANLSQEELYVLLTKLRDVQANGDPANHVIPDHALTAFMTHCSNRMGAKYFQTPRNTIKAFVQLLSILEQNRAASWEELLGAVSIEDDENPELQPLPNSDAAQPSVAMADDGLTEFRL